jgi:hypothetical protein
MKIRNTEGLSAADLLDAAAKGGRFIYYSYTVSLFFATFKRTSDVYLVKAGESPALKGFIFSFVTFLLGWWALPNGPKYTWKALRSNLEGGIDVTEDVLSTAEGFLLFEEAQHRKKAS